MSQKNTLLKISAGEKQGGSSGGSHGWVDGAERAEMAPVLWAPCDIKERCCCIIPFRNKLVAHQVLDINPYPWDPPLLFPLWDFQQCVSLRHENPPPLLFPHRKTRGVYLMDMGWCNDYFFGRLRRLRGFASPSLASHPVFLLNQNSFLKFWKTLKSRRKDGNGSSCCSRRTISANF